MIRIIGGRGTGKTLQLMLLAKEYNALFVCSYPEAMKVKAESYGITGIKFVSYSQFLREDDSDFKNVVIDELEVLVRKALLGTQNLVAYTLSDEKR